MAKRKSSKEIMEGWVVRGDSSTASSDQGYSSAAGSSSAGEDRKPAAAAAKKQRSIPSMAIAAAASSGGLPPLFPAFTQQSPAAAAAAAASAAAPITPEEQQLLRTRVVCKYGKHAKAGNGTPVPLGDVKTKLSKTSGLPLEADVINHVRRIEQLGLQIPLKATCDFHLGRVARHNAKNNAKNNAATSAELVATKRAAAEAVQLTGGLDRILSKPEILAKRDELSAPGTLLHSLIDCLPLPGSDTPPAKALPFNINLGLLRRYGGKGPDGEQLVEPKDCKPVEGFAFTTTRGGYRGRVTEAGRDNVSNPAMYFKTQVIYVSRRRFNAGELEKALLKMCIDKLRVPHLINQNRGGWSQKEQDAEWQAVSVTYLDLSVSGAEELVIHMGGKRIGA
jgi:hypothetical protein